MVVVNKLQALDPDPTINKLAYPLLRWWAQKSPHKMKAQWSSSMILASGNSGRNVRLLCRRSRVQFPLEPVNYSEKVFLTLIYPGQKSFLLIVFHVYRCVGRYESPLCDYNLP